MAPSHPSSFPPVMLRRALCAAALAVALSGAFAASYTPDPHERLLNLAHERWRFSIGDDARWSDPEFDDRGWTRIQVPSSWEDEGYDSYNGYAWYRCRFSFTRHADEATYLVLGQIDDVDEVFVNGRRVGSAGRFPPNFVSAWDRDRIYALPAGVLDRGKDNVIAVRVYDGGGEGGIRGHAVGLYTGRLPVPLVDLTGEWLFRPGDNLSWKDAQADLAGFVPVLVPNTWESAGYGDLDGFGWYRKTFDYAGGSTEQTMVMMLGKIDDTDEVYLNGTRIGSTGNLNDSDRQGGVAFHDENRGYFFPASLLRPTNVVAVRVHDHGGLGGIYRGPVGIIAQKDYIAYWESIRQDHSARRAVRRFFRNLNND